MKENNFEYSLKELENIVDILEEGKLDLENSLELFQKGIYLSKQCSQVLDKAEQKVHILVKDNCGNMNKMPFEINEEE